MIPISYRYMKISDKISLIFCTESCFVAREDYYLYVTCLIRILLEENRISRALFDYYFTFNDAQARSARARHTVYRWLIKPAIKSAEASFGVSLWRDYRAVRLLAFRVAWYIFQAFEKRTSSPIDICTFIPTTVARCVSWCSATAMRDWVSCVTVPTYRRVTCSWWKG